MTATTSSTRPIAGSMCPSCGAPKTIVATAALTSAEAHIEHDSALLATTSPSSVGRPRSRAASRMSAISACAVGSAVVAWAFAASSSTVPSGVASTAPNGASPRAAAIDACAIARRTSASAISCSIARS